jgi:hypothetical protein
MNQKNAPIIQNNKLLESGIYKNTYLVYNRKSTDEPENQKNSIHFQKINNYLLLQSPLKAFVLMALSLKNIQPLKKTPN